MRRHGIEEPYEKLKGLTRGQRVTLAILQEFIAGLDIPAQDKAVLAKLSPGDYIGNAVQQTEQIISGGKGQKPGR